MAVFNAWFGPGLIAGNDFHTLHVPAGQTGAWPSRWDDANGLGDDTQYWSPGYPLIALAWLFVRIGMTPELIERIIVLWPYAVLVPLAAYIFFALILRDRRAAAVAATIFVLNTWTVGTIERGHLFSVLAYGWMPLVLLAVRSLALRPGAAQAWALAGCIWLQCIYDVRYVYVTGIVVGLVFLARWRSVTPWLRAHWPLAGHAAFAILALNLYWVLPQALQPSALPRVYTQPESLVQVSGVASLTHALLDFYPYYHAVSGSNPFAASAPEPVFVVLLLAFVIALVTSRRWRLTALAVWLCGVLVLAGPLSPVGWVSRFFYMFVPGGRMFRDILKFSALVNLAYAFGVGQALIALRRPGRAAATALAVIAYVAWLGIMHDAFDSRRYSVYHAYTVTADDLKLQAFLAAQPPGRRTILFPHDDVVPTGSPNRPVVNGGMLAVPTPDGMHALNPERFPLLGTYRNDIGRALLGQLAADWLVVDDDSTGFAFTPFGYDVERGEAVRTFAELPWLRRGPSFGRHELFRIMQPPAAPMFVAPLPAYVGARPEDLAALSGTAFVGPRMALETADMVATGLAPAGFARPSFARPAQYGVLIFDAPGTTRAVQVHAAFESIDVVRLWPLAPGRHPHVPLWRRPRIFLDGDDCSMIALQITGLGRRLVVQVPADAARDLSGADAFAAADRAIDDAAERGDLPSTPFPNAALAESPDTSLFTLEGARPIGCSAHARRPVRIEAVSHSVVRAAEPRPRLLIDGHVLPAPAYVRAQAVDGARSVVVDVRVPLSAGPHELRSADPRRFRLNAALVAADALRASPAADIDLHRLSPVEFTGDLPGGGGVLVWAQHFDPGWKLYVLSDREDAPRGDIVADTLRLWGRELPESRHVIVNGAYNAWSMPASRARFVALFVPEAYNRLAVGVWLIVIVIVALTALLKALPRRRSAGTRPRTDRPNDAA